MALERVDRPGGRYHVLLTECPFCGYTFGWRERRGHHLREHDPEDAGLSPLGERGDADGPLFETVATDGGEPADG